MEYNDLQSFERLTGLAFFTPAGQAGAIAFGNIEMVKIDYGTKSVDQMVSVRGKLLLGRRDTFQVVPVFSIDGNQFATPMIPLLLLGTALADVLQYAGTGNTFTFTAAPGLAYLLGAYNISSVVVRVGGTVLALGTDYFLDSFNGIVSLPVHLTITPGATVTVTFNQPALVLEHYSAFTNLNTTGTLVVFAEDEYGPPAKEIWTMNVTISCKKSADIDVTKFRKFTLEAALLGTPDVRKRGAGLDSIGTGGDSFLV